MRERWTDPEPAQWIVERIHDFAVDVGSIIPEGFDAYTRLFHPAALNTPEGERSVRWSEVAAASGRVVHAEMQWANISGVESYSGGFVPGLWDGEPMDRLPRDYADSLGELLASHTTTPERIWFGLWNGYGFIDSAATAPLRRGRRFGAALRNWGRRRRARSGQPTLLLPHRDYLLYVGAIETITESFDESGPFWAPPNLWWPDDRAWFVASEIDFSWTYVGGTKDCIDEVLADERLEAVPASIDHKITYAGDTINPLPGSGGPSE